MWNIRRLAPLAVLFMTLATWSLAQQPTLSEADRNELSILMRAKLSSSQKVVEGLMAGDFDMIRKGGWICSESAMQPTVAATTIPYTDITAELKLSALWLGKLIEQAAARNLDGAAYGYMHSLTTCINCHDHCRNVLRVANVSPQVIPIPVTEQETFARQRSNLYR